MGRRKRLIGETNARIARVREAVQAFVARQGADETHDLRTSIRRLSVCVSLLPKRARKARALAAFVDACALLRDACAPLRDADVGAGLLDRFPPDVGEALAASVEGESRDAKKKAKKRAREVLAVEAPEVKRGDVGKKRLASRMEKKTREVFEEARDGLSKVAARPTPGRVHAARRSARKLRYALEVVARTHDPRIPRLAAVQDALGALHDRDVLLARLRALAPTAAVREAMASVAGERRAFAAQITAAEDAPSPRRALRRR